MTPSELWEKYAIDELIDRDKFLAALAEYGQAVRARDAEICKGMAEDQYPCTDTANDCAAAISREPLP